MAQLGEDEILKSTGGGGSEGGEKVVLMENKEEGHHPYAFHVSGPRNVSSPNWRDLISSSWLVPQNFFSTFTRIFHIPLWVCQIYYSHYLLSEDVVLFFC